jgi:hypothetical protein
LTMGHDVAKVPNFGTSTNLAAFINNGSWVREKIRCLHSSVFNSKNKKGREIPAFSLTQC